jgi:hypothetical protein
MGSRGGAHRWSCWCAWAAHRVLLAHLRVDVCALTTHKGFIINLTVHSTLLMCAPFGSASNWLTGVDVGAPGQQGAVPGSPEEDPRHLAAVHPQPQLPQALARQSGVCAMRA